VSADEVAEGGVVAIRAARAYLTKHEGEVVAIAEKCPHLGCRVSWCETSGEFECPCHGSVFNRLGEHRAGPSPRGMDRFPVSIEDGVVSVDTGSLEKGDAPGTESIDEPSRGPSCAGSH
jgi:cytochrome b6-f complex iron-sulfur subunit